MVTYIKTWFLGPRVEWSELHRAKFRYLLPTLLLVLAGVLLLVSCTKPYWSMTLFAPQYPKGLTVTAYLTHLTGDVQEIDGLNHYIGMAPLEKGGQFERSTAIGMIIVLACLLGAAILVHTRWAALLALPALIFPLLFLADLQFWLYHFGNHLDKHAALSSAIKPFTPVVLGPGKVGQFKTIASAQMGLHLAACASVVLIVALFFHRRAYKPLFDARKQAAGKSEG